MWRMVSELGQTDYDHDAESTQNGLFPSSKYSSPPDSSLDLETG